MPSCVVDFAHPAAADLVDEPIVHERLSREDGHLESDRKVILIQHAGRGAATVTRSGNAP